MINSLTLPSPPLAFVIGAGGHAKVVIGILRALGYSISGVFDDNPRFRGAAVAGVSVIGTTADLPAGAPAVIAIGNNRARQSIVNRVDATWLTLVHPAAVVDPTAKLGEGTVVVAGCVVQAAARIGRHVIVNTAASVDHDCVVEDFVHLCPGVRLPGEVTLRTGVTMGAASVAIPGVEIGAWTTVGAGAVVVANLPGNCTAVGVPARPRSSGQASTRRIADSTISVTLPVHFQVDTMAEVVLLEREFAETIQLPCALAVSSGTAAVRLALSALRIEPGDEVLVSALESRAATRAIVAVDARPVFVDSDWRTWNIDPDKLSDELEKCQQRGTMPKAVVAVDAMGQCADYEVISKICAFYEVPVIEVASQALGAHVQGRAAGSFGVIGCFSFSDRHIVSSGAGGMVVTASSDLGERLRAAICDDEQSFDCDSDQGARMSGLLAVLARRQLPLLAARVEQFRHRFVTYQQQLADLPGLSWMPEPVGWNSTRWQAAVRIDAARFGVTRDVIQGRLAEAGYPVSHPELGWNFTDSKNARRASGSVATALAETVLYLPAGDWAVDDGARRIAEIFQACYRSATTVAGVHFVPH